MRTKNCHHGESRSSRADKMSGSTHYKNHEQEKFKRLYGSKLTDKLEASSKKFFNRKRRMFLKNPLFYTKI